MTQELTLALLSTLPEKMSNRNNILYLEPDSDEFGDIISFLLAQERPDYIALDGLRNSGFFETAMGMGSRNKTIMSTINANNPLQALSYFLIKAIEENNSLISDLEIKESIGEGLDLILFNERLNDGSRKTSLIEVIEYNQEKDTFILKELNK